MRTTEYNPKKITRIIDWLGWWKFRLGNWKVTCTRDYHNKDKTKIDNIIGYGLWRRTSLNLEYDIWTRIL